MQYPSNPTGEHAFIAPEQAPRERLGLVVEGGDAASTVATIEAAEAAGVRQIWMNQYPSLPDILTLFGAAAVRTTTVRLGTAIVPTYPHHPLDLAKQALALSDLAPGRFRLGVGPSHRSIIEDMYGLPLTAPFTHLREYVAVLRAALWEGTVDHHGRFYSVVATLPRTPHIPLLVSALREGAFRLAGEISDGAISWLCPVPYLLKTALPALREAAARNGRTTLLVAHTLVAISKDRDAARTAIRQQFQRYLRLPFYINMFADAGFPEAAEGTMSDALIDSIAIIGDETLVATQLMWLLNQGIDETLISLVPVADEQREMGQLMQLIGQL